VFTIDPGRGEAKECLERREVLYLLPVSVEWKAFSWRRSAQQIDRRRYSAMQGTALEASDFPEPIAKSRRQRWAARKLKKQDPWQVGPVETRLANPSESALWACQTPLSYAKSTTAMRGGKISIQLTDADARLGSDGATGKRQPSRTSTGQVVV